MINPRIDSDSSFFESNSSKRRNLEPLLSNTGSQRDETENYNTPNSNIRSNKYIDLVDSDEDEDDFERIGTNLEDPNNFSQSQEIRGLRGLSGGPRFGSQIRKSIKKNRKRSGKISNSFGDMDDSHFKSSQRRIQRRDSNELDFNSSKRSNRRKGARKNSHSHSRQSDYLIE